MSHLPDSSGGRDLYGAVSDRRDGGGVRVEADVSAGERIWDELDLMAEGSDPTILRDRAFYIWQQWELLDRRITAALDYLDECVEAGLDGDMVRVLQRILNGGRPNPPAG